MSRKLAWTAALDERLRHLRHHGQDWDAIATALGVGRNAAMERARHLRARIAPRVMTAKQVEDPDRPPLPAGHKISWAVLVGGTVLANEPYPRAMPMGRERRGVIGEAC